MEEEVIRFGGDSDSFVDCGPLSRILYY